MLDGKSLYDAMVQERVNKTAGVPTIYSLLLQHVSSTKSAAPPSLKTVLIGGSACPPSMIQAFDDLGVNVQHAVSPTPPPILKILLAPHVSSRTHLALMDIFPPAR